MDRSVRALSTLVVSLLVAGACGSSTATATPAPPTAVVTPAQPTASIAPTAAPTPTQAPTATPVPTPTPPPPQWASAGSMHKPRLTFPLITLQDGRVLAVGNGYNVCQGECSGFPGPAQSSIYADLYDASANTWTAVKGLNLDRSAYSTVLLKDGRVLVSGGYADPPNVCYQSAKLFDPKSNTWTQTTSLMKQDRCAPAGTLLQDGRVLLAGGINYKYKLLSNAEVFDPSNQSWALVASMPGARYGAQAVTLGNGKVLVAGGYDTNGQPLASDYLYDPQANTWASVGPLSQPTRGQLIVLADGSAMMVGEGHYDGGVWQKEPSERFDPATNTWKKTRDMAASRSGPSVVLLLDGRVMVAGGAVKVALNNNTGRVTTLTKTVELYDPQTDTWKSTTSMATAREHAAAALLADGSVLIAGGDLGEQGFPSTPGGYAITVIATAIRYVP